MKTPYIFDLVNFPSIVCKFEQKKKNIHDQSVFVWLQFSKIIFSAKKQEYHPYVFLLWKRWRKQNF